MSTLDGHSALHDLHSRHRSSTWYIRSDWTSSIGSAPDIAARSAFARPLVECSSSRVAMYEGHIAPELTFRHAPTPLHRSIAPANPPSAFQSSFVVIVAVLYLFP